ncbi:MAG: hypothetical protein WC282_02380 [Bacilli bacterium]|jgi:hypothetical protein
MKNRSLLGILATGTLATLLSIGVSLNIMQTASHEARAASVEYVARDVFQMNRIRYDSGWPNGIGTRWEEAAFSANIWDMSYGRLILDASSAGNYTIGLRYASGEYPIKVFVNGVSADYTLPNNGWGNTVYDLTVSLLEGENVFIVAVLKWGVINAVVIPDGVTLIDEDTSGGVYSASCSDLQNTYLKYVNGTVHEPATLVYTAELAYDSNPTFTSLAQFDVVAGANAKSIDLTYHAADFTDGIAELALTINGGTSFNVEVYETANDLLSTISLPTAVLTTNGFVAGTSNAITIAKSASNSEKIGLVSLALKDDEVLSYSTTRVEAESSTISGGNIDTGTTVWSNSSYVKDMGTKTALSGPQEISADLSNVNSLSFSYTASQTGAYKLAIRYATGVTSVAYARADQGPWVSINFQHTYWWDNPRVAIITINMNAGSRTITLTGTTNDGGWINYDFIDIVQKGTLSDADVALNYANFFRDQTSAGCQARNVNLIPWSQLKSEYLALSSAVKDEYVSSTNSVIIDARARYEVLINAYSILAADNWLVDGDNVAVFSSNLVFESSTNSQTYAIAVVAISIILSALGLFYVVRKRRSA